MPDVIVIGGGVAGLTAAAHLAESGLHPLLLEANQSWLGGRLAGGEPESFTHNGQAWAFPSEHGIHALWGGYANMRATIARFIADEALHPVASEGEVWINRWGERVWAVEAGSAVRSKLLPAPFHYMNLLLRPRFWGGITPLDFLSTGGLLFSILWTVGYDPLEEKSALPGFTLDDYFRLWTPNLRATIEGVARNMLAAPDEQITLTGLIAALRFYTMLRRNSWHPHFFPANSATAYIGPMAASIRARGGDICTGQTVYRLSRTADGWRVLMRSADGTPAYADAPRVILAVQPSAARTILTTSDPTRSQAQNIPFPPVIRNLTVRLWFDAQPQHTAPSGMFTGDFVPDNYFWLHRIHREFATWADQGGSAIELHFYKNDDDLNQPDRYFMATALNEVHRAFPELKGHWVYGAIRRNSKVHTAFRVMTEAMLHVQTPWDGLYACGDWVGYNTPSLWMERASTTGIAAANAVLVEAGLAAYPIQQPPLPEAPVRVLGAGVRGVRAASKPLITQLRRYRTRQPL